MSRVMIGVYVVLIIMETSGMACITARGDLSCRRAIGAVGRSLGQQGGESRFRHSAKADGLQRQATCGVA